MVATIGPGWAIAADALTFLISALFVAQIRSGRRPARRETTFFRDLADGWRIFRSQTWLWVDGVDAAIGNCMVFAPFLALGPVVALRSLGGAPGTVALAERRAKRKRSSADAYQIKRASSEKASTRRTAGPTSVPRS